MIITLRKVGKIPLDFEIKNDGITFKGYLQYDCAKLILLKANLSGFFDIMCDICGESFKLFIDENIEFFISDGVYKDSQNILEDIVECLDSKVDLVEIMKSEIEFIKCDYNSCENCKMKGI